MIHGYYDITFIPRLHDTTGCQSGCTTRFDNRLYARYNRLSWQPVVWCIQTFNRLSNRFDNRFDNRLNRVNGALDTF